MKSVKLIVLALVAISSLLVLPACGQGGNPPASTKESGQTSSKGMTARRYINLPTRPVQAPFSDGVLIGDTLYIAGRIGLIRRPASRQKIWSRKSKS